MLTKLRRCVLYRSFSNSVIRKNLEKKPSETSASTGASEGGFVLAKMPTKFEKKILIYSGRYKTMEEIPKLVPEQTIENSTTKLRIKIANLMIVLTLIACGTVIYNGKAARKEKIRKWEEGQLFAEAEKKQSAAVQQD